MWNTKQLLDLISKDMPEVPPERVLEYISRAYLGLVNQDCSTQVFYSTDIDNLIPKLEVIEGQSRYLLNEATLNPYTEEPIPEYLLVDNINITIRKARRVFVEGRRYGYKPYSPMGFPDWAKGWFTKRSFYEIPAQIIEQRGSNPGQIVIMEKDIDTDVYVECYWTPPDPKNSIDTPLLINTDRWLDAIIDGAIGYYEMSCYGRSERLVSYLKFHMPKFKSYGNLDQSSIINTEFPTRI